MDFNWKDKKFWLKVGALVLLIPFILNITLFQFTTRITYKGGDWLSFWGSYLGGFSSGVIALIVAMTTIQADRNKHSYDIMIRQLPVMARIKMELQKILDNIDKATQVRERVKGNHSNFESVDKNYSYNVELIDKEKWESLDRLQDIELQMKLIEVKQFYETFSESLHFDMLGKKQDLKLNRLAIAHSQRVNPLDPFKEYRMKNEITELDYEIDYYCRIRKDSFNKLKDGYRNEIELTLQALSSAMNELQLKKERFEERLN
ncbi:hypothetical protein NMK43_09025 [Bacillus licheniformis]|uniref:hypothetical protein n=1 Tax=Bacillus licheniformis TaxID=1402 RepID=UPI0020C8CAC4|nr:hypothetical protein [Bacillus licheniformis]MCP8973237.1 hypothetical protein [Bacillus licheniformis]